MMMLDYQSLKHIHMGLAFASATLFLLRGAASVADRYHPSRIYRILVHLIDTLLLVFGAWLAYRLSLSPLDAPWLGAKIIALVVYILLGAWLMRVRRTGVRVIAYMAALSVLAYIFVVALSKSPVGEHFLQRILS